MKKKWPLIVLGIVLLILVVGGIGVFCLYQFTDVFGKKVIPRKVDSIEIRYAPGYNITTAEALNETETFVEIQTITLKGDELKKLKKEVSKIRENKEKSEEKIAVDDYELTINKNIKVLVGSGYGLVTNNKKKTSVKIPSSCMNEIEKIVEQNNKKVIKTLTTENAHVKIEGAAIQIKNKDNLQYIQEYLTYYPVTLHDDFKTYDDGYDAELLLDNNVVLYLYANSQIAYLSMKEGETDQSTYVVLLNDLYGLVHQIYETSTK